MGRKDVPACRLVYKPQATRSGFLLQHLPSVSAYMFTPKTPLSEGFIDMEDDMISFCEEGGGPQCLVL